MAGHGLAVAAALPDGQHVLAVGLGAGAVPGVVVAVQQAAVGQAHHVVGGGLLGGHVVGTLHPPGVLGGQGGVELGEDLPALDLGQHLHHQAEERRLAARQVVGPVAVGDVADGGHLVGEVLYHIAHQLVLAGFAQAEQGEVAVPVVHLAEAAAGHHVIFRQGDQAPLGALVGPGLAGEDGPQALDVGGDVAVGVAAKAALGLGRGIETGLDERSQVEVGRVLLRGVLGHDLSGRPAGDHVHEGFPVGEDPFHLYAAEEFAVALVRGDELAGFAG